MKVDLPAPGTPVMPMRSALPVRGSRPWSTLCALSKSLGALLSIKVMALERATRSPFATPSIYCSTVIFLRSGTLRSGASGYSLAPVMLLAVVSMPRMTEQANSGFFSSGTQLGLRSSLLSGIFLPYPSLASSPKRTRLSAAKRRYVFCKEIRASISFIPRDGNHMNEMCARMDCEPC